MLQPPLFFRREHRRKPSAVEVLRRSLFGWRASAMGDNSQTHWYLVRTKTGKERWVRDQLANRVPEVFLPMLKAKVPRWGRMTMSIAPLFPCYVFARFDLQSQYFD